MELVKNFALDSLEPRKEASLNTWDYKERATGRKYRVVAIFEQGKEYPAAVIDICTAVRGAAQLITDRVIKSFDAAYIQNGRYEIEYTDLDGHSYAEALPPLSKISVLQGNKYIDITEKREYVA